MKPKIFFYHYNKPLTQKFGKPVISVHFDKRCVFVDNIVCNVKTWGHIKKTQPRFIVKGRAKLIEIKDGVAYIS